MIATLPSAIQLVENKAQRWRAIVVYQNGNEGLLLLGSSLHQIRMGYIEPWFDFLDDEERSQVREILLQKWMGAVDHGRWVTQSYLNVPPR